MDSILKGLLVDRINRINKIFILGFQKKPRNFHPPAAEKYHHHAKIIVTGCSKKTELISIKEYLAEGDLCASGALALAIFFRKMANK